MSCGQTTCAGGTISCGFQRNDILPSVTYYANLTPTTTTKYYTARLRPMRGLKRDPTAKVIVAGHALVQNLRRRFYDLGTDMRPSLRLADAFAELASRSDR